LILDWKNSLEFPEDEIQTSKEAIDLMTHLICDRKNRYGYAEIINHPWLKGLDPNTIRQTKAPWQPPVQSEVDTQNFDEFDDPNYNYFFGDEGSDSNTTKPYLKDVDEKQLPFVGWTFRRFEKKQALKPRLEQLFLEPEDDRDKLMSPTSGKNRTPGRDSREKDSSSKGSKEKTPPKAKAESSKYKTTKIHDKERKEANLSISTFEEKK